MSDDTTHHLMFAEAPEGRLLQARMAWHENAGSHANEAGAASVRLRDTSDPNDVPRPCPHRPALWISFEARGAQEETVAAFAAEFPDLIFTFVWYDANHDAAARYLYEGGEFEEAEELSYGAGYFYTYGEDDPNLAEWDDEELAA